MEVEIADFYPRRNRRGLDFHYVREGDKLYHISRYAKSKKKEGNRIRYIIDFEIIAGKSIYNFSRNNSGNSFFFKYRATSPNKKE